eukprot:GHVR01151781.1.p1 GENE.GHVR01151781.1~~GHVR01151781.1.p1  ORF type:complete len:264 (-),score=31.66 GHVR01151781.1:73-864(-)
MGDDLRTKECSLSKAPPVAHLVPHHTHAVTQACSDPNTHIFETSNYAKLCDKNTQHIIDTPTQQSTGPLLESVMHSVCSQKMTADNSIKFKNFQSPTREYDFTFINNNTPTINVANACYFNTVDEKNLIQELVTNGVLTRINPHECQVICNSFFVGEGNKTRLITDFKSINKYMKKIIQPSFMESKNIAINLSRPGFRANLDLTRAFYSIPLSKQSRKFAGTVINGIYYQYNKLPMGCTQSPGILQARLDEILPKKSGGCDIY